MAEVFKTFAIALDTKVASYIKIPVVEGDTGNRFVITLTDDGVAVDLSTSRVTAVFSGAMGTAMQDSFSGTDGQLVISGASHNIITFDILNGSYSNGLNTCEIQVYSGATYSTLITSAMFSFDARKPILNDETIAATESYPTLVYWAGKYQEMLDREQADFDETDNTKGTYIRNKPVVDVDFQAPTDTLTAETTLSDADTVPFYDALATAHRKSTWANIVAKIRTAFFGSVTGVAKLDGAGNVSAAAANTDFAAATHASRHASGAADELTPASIGAEKVRLPFVNTLLLPSDFTAIDRSDGENLFDGLIDQGSIAGSDGLNSESTTAIRCANYFQTTGGHSYTFSYYTEKSVSLYVFWYNGATFLSYTGCGNGASKTAPSGTTHARFTWLSAATIVPADLIRMMVNAGSTAATYEKYISYGYQAKKALTGVLSTMFPQIAFGIDPTVATDAYRTYDGGVKFYAAAVPTTAVVIPSIVCWKAVS